MSQRHGAASPNRGALEQAGVDLPAILDATVPLARRGSGKWHVATPNPIRHRWGGGCPHAHGLKADENIEVPFLDLLDGVCAKCVPAAALPDPVRGLWTACLAITEADHRARSLVGGSGLRTWPGYARALAAGAHHDDEAVRALLKPWLDHDEVGEQAWIALAAWTAVIERSNLALADYQAAAPAADTTAAISRACDTVAEDPAVHATSRALDTAVGREYRYGPAHTSLWPLVRAVWSAARRQGRCAEAAVTLALTAAQERWGAARVRDVTVLPTPARVPAGSYATPAAWADELLRLWWREAVTTWCTRLEDALDVSATEEDGRTLLLVRDWPLTRPGDEELAYLSQFPQRGPTVPDERDADPYNRTASQAVVLSVPHYAADQAVEHARYQSGRITPGGPDDARTSDPGPSALALLRTVYPYLPEDVLADGASSEPSAAVRTARAAERAARDTQEQPHWSERHRAASTAMWQDAFRSGRWTWVPDDTDNEAAPPQLTTLLQPSHDWQVMRLHVECGPAGDTSLHTLFGHPEGWDSRRGALRFRPAHGHRTVTVAQHRIVGLTGDPYRRGGGRAPLWEAYRSPQAPRSW
ncbi:hypothetical protein [Kitasatospora sp. NBC_01300]|uniref:hypothetical protein n=1 Tax=Kitasatospora sp. NBC_01300 TaxID=2903574 RepID=UPI002F91B3D2|nr:hypothetical protein OG556_39885 [Kitasatospora sp. NBC_01300]